MMTTQPLILLRNLDLDNQEDIASVTKIYAHHVTYGTGSFEITPPDEAEIKRRFTALYDRNYPVILACHNDDNAIAGFAYFGPYKERAAYHHTVEDSIYVHHDYLRLGIGQLMLAKLIERAADAGFLQMMAVIGDSDNAGSIGIHSAMGFQMIGTARNIGHKFGRFLDVVYMQKDLSQ